jgi:Acetyltransferase (GNAT) family
LNIQVRLAKIDETEQIRNLLKEIAVWFNSKEIDQWTHMLSGSADAEIEEAIINEETYVLDMDNKIWETFTVSTKQSEWDRQIWGESNDRSLYLLRLAIGLEFKGSGLGLKALHWLEDNFANRTEYLKLDCLAHNQKLNEFYKKCSFNFVGQTNGFNK